MICHGQEHWELIGLRAAVIHGDSSHTFHTIAWAVENSYVNLTVPLRTKQGVQVIASLQCFCEHGQVLGDLRLPMIRKGAKDVWPTVLQRYRPLWNSLSRSILNCIAVSLAPPEQVKPRPGTSGTASA
eukprot:scpid84236/ scgid16185/ 